MIHKRVLSWRPKWMAMHSMYGGINSQRRWTVSIGGTGPTDHTGLEELRLFSGGPQCSFELGMSKKKAIKLAELLNKERF